MTAKVKPGSPEQSHPAQATNRQNRRGAQQAQGRIGLAQSIRLVWILMVADTSLRADGRSAETPEPDTAPLELTVLMPCLNEAETLESCIRKAKSYLERSGVVG